MSLTHSLRRTAVGVAATAMLVGGALGFVSVAGAAGAESNVVADVATTLPANGIALNNATASTETDCPAGGAAYWHFVLAPNSGSAFVSITLNLGTETRTFSGDELVKNGVQTDNVFVAVPAGFTLTSIVKDGSYAVYSGATPTNFNLSHTCAGTIPTTSSTSSTSSTTSSTSTSTTSTSSTSSTSTSTTSSTTSTSVAPTTTEAPTTSTNPEESTTSSTVGTAAAVEVLGTVQTQPEVAGAVQAQGALPYTGTNTVGLVAAGLSILLGGLLLVALARTKGRAAQQ
jgi:LPXTG-motif cell wall-anchored protein